MKLNRKKFSDAYLRFKRQLDALKEDDLRTVKRLAREARHELELKRTGRMSLPLSY